MRQLILLLGLLLLLPLGAAGRSTHGLPDLATEQQAWWGDMARGYVVEGCLPTVPSPASFTLTLPPCRAYGLERAERRLYYLWEPTARTLTLPATTGRTWLAGHASVAETVPGWTRLAGTHYLWQMNEVIPEAPDGGVLLAAVDVSGGVITVVGDARPDSPLPGAAANLRSPLFGAAGDCSSDDTAAMQAWVNNVAWRNTEGYAPAGCYRFSRLWLTWDATANPGFPPAFIERGGYAVRGAGPAQVYHQTRDKRTWPGTVWWSSVTDAPAIIAYGDTGAGTGNAARGIRLENLSVVQASTTEVINFDGVHSRAGMRDLFVVQEGIGHGIVWHNTFLAWMEDLFVTTNNVSNVSTGVHLLNNLVGGGVIRLTNVTARGFGLNCVRIGGNAIGATRLMAVKMEGVQGTACPVGMDIGGGVRSLQCSGCYFEHFTTFGIRIVDNAQGVTIEDSLLSAGDLTGAGTAAIRIGAGTGQLEDAAYAVTIRGNTLLDVNQGYGIWRDIGAAVQGALILANHLTLGADAVAGIHCGAAATTQHGLQIFGNVFAGAGATTNPVDASCRSGEIIYDPQSLWIGRRLNLGQGLPLASATTITLLPDGNLYNLTGSETITTIACATCTNGAFAWFYVPSGSAPVMTEAGNILLDDTTTPANQWTGSANAVLGLLYNAGKWLEMYRKDN